MLNSSVHRLFSEKTARAHRIMHSVICQTSCQVVKTHKRLMFLVTYLVKCNGAYYIHKNAGRLVLVPYDSQKIKKAVIGPVVTRY